MNQLMDEYANNVRGCQTQRQEAEAKIASARGNLLLMVILTAVNLIILATGSDTMLLFSATIPYLSLMMGLVMEIPAFLGVTIAFAVVILLAYLLCWWMSKKHYGWMIAALVMFAVDTLCMAMLYIELSDFSGIMDVAIHAWVIYYLVIGVKYGRQLKTLPKTPAVASEASAAAAAEYPVPAVMPENTPVLRRAYEEDKARILLEADAIGRHICFRKVKQVYELIIDNHVYAEYTANIFSPAPVLNAWIDGHAIQVKSEKCSILTIDGQVVEKKIRWY